MPTCFKKRWLCLVEVLFRLRDKEGIGGAWSWYGLHLIPLQYLGGAVNWDYSCVSDQPRHTVENLHFQFRSRDCVTAAAAGDQAEYSRIMRAKNRDLMLSQVSTLPAKVLFWLRPVAHSKARLLPEKATDCQPSFLRSAFLRFRLATRFS